VTICRRLGFIVMLLMATVISAYAAPQFLRVSDKRVIDFKQLITDVYGSDVIIIGDTHDDEKHHENQLAIIRSLHAKKVPVAIGLEMFTSDNQQQLDDWVGGKLKEEDFQVIYSRNWSYNWMLYRDIFMFARDNHIPMIGINIPKGIVQKVLQHGFSSLGPAEKRILPPDVTCIIGSAYTDFLKLVYSQHGNNGQAFTFFCEAQALYNNGMAWNINKFRERFPKHKVVVITGTWHALKIALPQQLDQYGAMSYKVILPVLPEFKIQNATTDDLDYFMLK
jgi:uncharacterized iron-regulated protein